MPVNLSIKNVPDEIADRLRARARLHHRSLQRELLALLEQSTLGGVPMAAAARPPLGQRIGIEELCAQARGLFPGGTPGSVESIRAERDARSAATGTDAANHSTPA
ncbi:MAG: Arc family DNA-binding protein [Burkholderiales bacterium]|nr:MAG: Arc family DNA-binding protein [Burkholderiales bacterium]